MQLDRTHVVVRPRSINEICDLGLLVVRQYFAAICKALALGILPLALLNLILLGWIPLETEGDQVFDDETVNGRIRYLWLMSVMIFLETPLAGIFATHYIGQAVFEQRPPWKQVFRDVFSIAHRWIWILGILRGPAIAVLILLYAWMQNDVTVETLLILFLVVWVGFKRALRPHIPEIMLLERCPIRSRDESTLAMGKRSRLLHAPVSNECFSRFVSVGLMAIVFTVAVFFLMIFFRGLFAQRWNFSIFVQLVLVPTAMWIVAGFTVVIRFLCYLDNRIRLEGWDVELSVRAEAIRQFGEPPTSGGKVETA